jgi:protein involved in polysaccharide export with SLBB domain
MNHNAMRLRLLLSLLVLVMLSSCDRYLNRNMMLRTYEGYPYAQFDDTAEREYRLAPNDMLMVRVFANDGFDMVNLGGDIGSGQFGGAGQAGNLGQQGGMGQMGGAGMQGGMMQQGNAGNMRGGLGGAALVLRVEFDGFVKLPVAGRVYVEGLTARQAEMIMEDYYAEFINKPFVLVDISDKRIFLFMGASTTVVPLMRDNITLFEILASAGGIPDEGKADRIKLIRGDLRNPEVHLIDLSTLKGVQNANLVMQANDIVYVEVRKRYMQRSIEELAPFISLISFAVTTPLTLVALFAR